MAMTAREAMRAMLEGGTVAYRRNDGDIHKFKLSDDGTIIDWYTPNGKWEPAPWMLNSIDDIYEESPNYPLTFEQALHAMLDGKVVEVRISDANLRIPHRFNRDLSCFEYYSTESCGWWETQISECEQRSKWKVVE